MSSSSNPILASKSICHVCQSPSWPALPFCSASSLAQTLFPIFPLQTLLQFSLFKQFQLQNCQCHCQWWSAGPDLHKQLSPFFFFKLFCSFASLQNCQCRSAGQVTCTNTFPHFPSSNTFAVLPLSQFCLFKPFQFFQCLSSHFVACLILFSPGQVP